MSLQRVFNHLLESHPGWCISSMQNALGFLLCTADAVTASGWFQNKILVCHGLHGNGPNFAQRTKEVDMSNEGWRICSTRKNSCFSKQCYSEANSMMLRIVGVLLCWKLLWAMLTCLDSMHLADPATGSVEIREATADEDVLSMDITDADIEEVDRSD
ncbi:hypothetical protein V8B97DRAFT_1915782 [Scleroderma yunnanense]